MPQIDVSDAFDIDTMDHFGVISSTLSVATGLSVVTPAAAVGAWGVVIPNKSTIRRMDDGTRLAANIDVYTQYPLTAGFKNDDTISDPADIVVWHGRQWTVAAVEDFSTYGAGFLHASCDLKPLMPTVQEPQQTYP